MIIGNPRVLDGETVELTVKNNPAIIAGKVVRVREHEDITSRDGLQLQWVLIVEGSDGLRTYVDTQSVATLKF
jgi:hypothetical protein